MVKVFKAGPVGHPKYISCCYCAQESHILLTDAWSHCHGYSVRRHGTVTVIIFVNDSIGPTASVRYSTVSYVFTRTFKWNF